MQLNELEILEDDFDLFVALDDSDKIEFLFDATTMGVEAAAVKQVMNLSEKYKPKVKPSNFNESKFFRRYKYN